MLYFKKCKIHNLNKVVGGVENTEYEMTTTGGKYRDYKYNDDEVNSTHSTPDCEVKGGEDKTFIRV